MKLRLESDDVLYMIQELACGIMKRTLTGDPTYALNEAHSAVTAYLGISIEFVVEGYDGVVRHPRLDAEHKKILDEVLTERHEVDYHGQPI